jgi:hypothetical protein
VVATGPKTPTIVELVRLKIFLHFNGPKLGAALAKRREVVMVGLGTEIKKLTSTIERHAACSSDIVVLQALLLNQLLSGEITSCKEHRSRHALGEQRTGCEPSIVPDCKWSEPTKSYKIAANEQGGGKTYHLMNADMAKDTKKRKITIYSL